MYQMYIIFCPEFTKNVVDLKIYQFFSETQPLLYWRQNGKHIYTDFINIVI